MHLYVFQEQHKYLLSGIHVECTFYSYFIIDFFPALINCLISTNIYRVMFACLFFGLLLLFWFSQKEE